VNVPAPTLRKVIRHLEGISGAEIAVVTLKAYLKPKVKHPFKGKGRKEEKARRRARFAEETRRIREAVWRRSGRCEACGYTTGDSYDQLDHVLGGSGRRRQRQSVETCWRLCWYCHRKKTENEPTRKWWAARFITHCEKYGYPIPREVIAWAEAA